MYSPKHILVNVKYLSRILSRKPYFLARLSRNYIKAFLNPNAPPIRFADVAVTYKCTMRCTHCSATEMEQNGKLPMTIDQYKIAAERLLKAGLLAVNFTGGEPLIRNDFYDIIRVFQPHKLLVAVQTNASLLSEEKMHDLKQLGVDSISISIDGGDAETHDKFRKMPGAFDKAMRMLGLGGKMGFNMGISYCLTHDNLYSEDRKKIVEISKKFNALLNYNLAVPIGFWKGNYENLITQEDRQYILRILEEYPRSKTDFETNYFKKGCGAIKEKLYINAYGEVIPCPFIQVTFGNILTNDVSEIRETAFRYRYFRDYVQRCLAAEDMEFIRNCRCYSKEAENFQMPLSHEEAFISMDKAVWKKDDSKL